MSSVRNVLKDNYNVMLLMEYLREQVKEAGFSHIDIAKAPTGTRVTLHVTRPGIVIGRKGSGIRELTERLEKDFGLKSPQITVEEMVKPELSPSVMCNRMASHIERGIAFRRTTMWMIRQIMDSGAMGVEITISGKLRGDRSSFEKHQEGDLPKAGHRADLIVAEDIAHVKTPMGLIGIRIRIARKEMNVEEFEFKKKGGGTIQVRDKITNKMRDETLEEYKARTESEYIAIEEEKIKELETLEEEEERLK